MLILSQAHMSRITVTRRIAIVVCAIVSLLACGEQATEKVRPPNIVLIVADDLGYSDLGRFGSEIETPNIDALARDGITLTNFHANATCTTSRAMLVTGIDNHAVGFGANPGVVKRFPEVRGRPGYLGEFKTGVLSLATRLKRDGYTTMLAGKWHLGSNRSSLPFSQGYERSFFLKNGGGSHFSDASGNLSDENPVEYWEGDERIKTLPDDFFSSTFYTDKIISYINEAARGDKPFFAHVAYTAPHWPLQAPDEWLDKYAGHYDRGWRAVRSERMQRMVAAGLIDESDTVSPLPVVLGSWEELSESDRRVEARRMEIYAAMISHLDHEIGRLVNYLKNSGHYDNTIIMFLSDNGPEGNDVLGVRDNADWVPKQFNLDHENMGRKGSYVWLGRGWAHVSAGPFSMYKSFLSEGGSRVPLIVKLPGQGGHASVSDELVSIIDIAPTILDVAGIGPGEISPMQGMSFLKALSGDSIGPSHDEPLAFEIYGARAVYRDHWKSLWLGPPLGKGEWQLFDLATDPGETLNLANDVPDVVLELESAWETFAEENDVYHFGRDIGYGRYSDQLVEEKL